jgi:hypothetical protein
MAAEPPDQSRPEDEDSASDDDDFGTGLEFQGWPVSAWGTFTPPRFDSNGAVTDDGAVHLGPLMLKVRGQWWRRPEGGNPPPALDL